jgi:hypothetical protein
MDRRKFIAFGGASATALIAGCSGSDSSEMEGGSRDDESTDDVDDESTDDSAGNGETENGESENGDDREDIDGSPNIEIADHERIVDEGEFSTDVYVRAVVENTGDAASGTLRIQVDWYNEDGNYTDNSSAHLRTLEPGETWIAHVYSYSMDGEGAEEYEIEGEFEEEPRDYDPENLDLVESVLEVSEGDFPEAIIRGEVENTGDEDKGYVEAVARVFNDEGDVMGDEWTNVTDLRAGDTWAFDVSWNGRDRVPEAADHEVLLTDRSW